MCITWIYFINFSFQQLLTKFYRLFQHFSSTKLMPFIKLFRRCRFHFFAFVFKKKMFSCWKHIFGKLRSHLFICIFFQSFHLRFFRFYNCMFFVACGFYLLHLWLLLHSIFHFVLLSLHISIFSEKTCFSHTSHMFWKAILNRFFSISNGETMTTRQPIQQIETPFHLPGAQKVWRSAPEMKWAPDRKTFGGTFLR